MFEFIATAGASARPRSGIAPAISLVVHATAVMVLLTINLTDARKLAPSRITAITLLAPVPAPVPRAAPVREDIRRAFAPPPRRFRSADMPPPAVLPLPVVLAPAIAIPRPRPPMVELRTLEAVAPPPLKIDNLAQPALATQVQEAPSAPVQLAGFATAKPAESPVRGSLRSAGFASVATGDVTLPRATAPLSRAGFGDAVVSHSVLNRAAAPATPTAPVEILSKPKPIYTEEARRLQIEGEVLIEVLFAAAGQVRILRMVRGLGHGLDENAIAAAEAIRFRPAERAGAATDSTAIVHIVFHLAY